MSLSFAEKRSHPRWAPSQLGRAPKVPELFQIWLQGYFFTFLQGRCPRVSKQGLSPLCGDNAGGSSLLPCSLQMRNFPNSLLAETPLGELVESIDKYLICDWAQMENELWDVLMGTYLERA